MTDQPSTDSVSTPQGHRPLRDDALAARRRHLFIVRVWWEPDDGGASGEWRGSIEHVPSRTKRYFRNLEALAVFIRSRLIPS